MTDSKYDILVLGATGYTGRLITRYLAAHPQKNQFSFALGARSVNKLKALVNELNLSTTIQLVHVDVTKEEDIDRAVGGARVVLNTVGPFWHWGTPVVRSCVTRGVHYVDITGETFWIKHIIREFDFAATKNRVLIVPSCGYDSVPSDISAFLANKTLKSLPALNGDYHQMGESISAQNFRGGVSGGTISSIITAVTQVPLQVMKAASAPYSLSPIIGRAKRTLRAIYNLPVPGEKNIIGGIFIMAPGNIQLVQRTFGLLELQERDATCNPNKDLAVQAAKIRDARSKSYGQQFSYDEFMLVHSRLYAAIFAVGIGIFLGMLNFSPTRWLLQKILPKPGEGPSDEQMQTGSLVVTNITTSASDPSVKVKTVIKGKGDPGYLLTAIMISESALSIILPPVSQTKALVGPAPRDNDHTNVSSLPALGQRGGVLTPMTAFGDILIQRLEETGRFEFSSSVVSDAAAKKSI